MSNLFRGTFHQKLQDSKVYRGGRTSRRLTSVGSFVELEARDGRIDLDFGMPSKGGGTTDVKVSLGADDFASIIEAMVKVDRQRALQGLSAILAREIADQPNVDVAISKAVKRSVKDAAENAIAGAALGRAATAAVREVFAQLEAVDYPSRR